jgi:hypothetical protein
MSDNEGENVNNEAPHPGNIAAGQQPQAHGINMTACVMPTLTPPPLDLKGANSASNGERWKLWKQQWNNFAVISNLRNQPEEYRVALFFHAIGTDALVLYNGMKFSPEEDKDELDTVLAKFDELLLDKEREWFERWKFNCREQKEGESIEQYVNVLTHMAKTCGFCNCMFDSLLRDRILIGIRDKKMQDKIINQHGVQELSLKTCIATCKSHEATSSQMKAMASSYTHTEHVDKVQVSKPRKPTFARNGERREKTGRKSSPPRAARRCKFCSGSHIFKKELCPAFGKTCKQCHEKNHFMNSLACASNSRNVHAVDHGEVEDEESSDDELIFKLESVSGISRDNAKAVYCQMMVDEKPLKFQIDCGATVNVLPLKNVPEKFLQNLKPSTVTLRMWNDTLVNSHGSCIIPVKNPKTGKKYRVVFIVVEKLLTPLLGRNAAEKMGLITINYETFKSVNAVDAPRNDIQSRFPAVFDGGLGILPGSVHFEVKDDVTPVICPPRKVPIALKGKLKQELQRLDDLGVITKMDEPSDWVSQMAVTTKKNGDLRICIDPRPLNKALKREHYPLTVIDDVLPELARAKVFSKLDLSNGYWHCVLDESSSKLTTFQTPFGRFRWLRLPFGTSVSSEIFQKRLMSVLDNLDGVICIADDMNVYGVGDTMAEAYEDHDKNLHAILQRCEEVGMKVNLDKCDFRKTEISFHGHLVTGDGLKVDPAKVEAILKLQTPTSVEEVRRLNGTINYLSRFLPKLSAVMEPIRQLTRKEVPWHWSDAQDKALMEVKQLITSTPVLAYYDPAEELVIQCDASDKGLGATVMQSGRPLAYASRALTDTETRYAQIEKETLAVVYSLEKFRQYTFGRKTLVHTDHKPLEAIVKKPLHSAPRRLQGMLLRIYEYDISVTWIPGKDMHVADMLSRAYLSDARSDTMEFEQVNMASHLPIREERLTQIKQETDKDDSLQTLKQIILMGWPDEKSELPSQAAPYFHMRDELCVQDGLIFKGERIVIPATLRSDMKKAVHTSHLGIGSCLRRARECLYWPGMSEEIKTYISTYDPCRKFETNQQKETLMPEEIPQRPWGKVGCDLFSFNNYEYLVTVDYYSNFFELDTLGHSLTAVKVIKKLKGQFARHGLPEALVSDNGPQFSSEEFKAFAVQWDFEHYTISPGNSRANGKAESAVKAAKSLLRKTRDANEDHYLALLELRNTPTQDVNSSPAQRLFNRRTRTRLPMTTRLLQPRTANLETEHEKLKLNQSKRADNYNKHAKDLPNLNEGNTVRLKPFKLGDRSWKKGVVTKRLDERSYEVATPDGARYRRNRVHLRHTQEAPPTMGNGDTYEEPQIHPNPTLNRSPTRGSRGNGEQPPKQADIIVDMPVADTHGDNPQPPTERPTQRRTGRASKPPAYLSDYITT